MISSSLWIHVILQKIITIFLIFPKTLEVPVCLSSLKRIQSDSVQIFHSFINSKFLSLVYPAQIIQIFIRFRVSLSSSYQIQPRPHIVVHMVCFHSKEPPGNKPRRVISPVNPAPTFGTVGHRQRRKIG